MKYDLILVGGGLANALIAYRLQSLRPRIRLLVLEQGDALGGNHTWSFHEADLTADQHRWMTPLVEHSWPGYEVRFPALRRKLEGRYACFTGRQLHQVVSAALGDSLHLNCRVESLEPEAVGLANGSVLRASAVVDGRGPMNSAHLVLRYQKFLGQEVELETPHGLQQPRLMDATVEQLDGYRFVYTLPFGERRVLIEDTRYSDTPNFEAHALRKQIQCYAEQNGWRIATIRREEIGVLPIVLAGDMNAFWEDPNPGVPRAGLRAGLFHPTTGYSLPEAVRLADALKKTLPVNSGELHQFIRQRSQAAWRRDAFFRALNRMLFLAGEPQQRFRILQRFYGLPEPLIHRFYAGRVTWTDRIRLLSGVPPVPLVQAVRALLANGSIRPESAGLGRS